MNIGEEIDYMSRVPDSCPLMDISGNCAPFGKFCTSIDDEICHGMRQAYERSFVEPEKVDGMRYAYGHTDLIGDCPACGLTVYKRINACYCGACGKRIKWE